MLKDVSTPAKLVYFGDTNAHVRICLCKMQRHLEVSLALSRPKQLTVPQQSVESQREAKQLMSKSLDRRREWGEEQTADSRQHTKQLMKI